MAVHCYEDNCVPMCGVSNLLLGKNNCVEYWCKELLESMDWCAGSHQTVEIILEMAYNKYDQ